MDKWGNLRLTEPEGMFFIGTLMPGSSAVERSAVNRLVAGSIPARAATFKQNNPGWVVEAVNPDDVGIAGSIPARAAPEIQYRKVCPALQGCRKRFWGVFFGRLEIIDPCRFRLGKSVSLVSFNYSMTILFYDPYG
jgi:hypothetical protein